MVYINCPHCGHKLMEGDKGSNVQIKCPKCNHIIKINFDNVKLEVILKEEMK